MQSGLDNDQKLKIADKEAKLKKGNLDLLYF